jgi:divalent metal cation (Fe/Co/Zn/Cd) transporter
VLGLAAGAQTVIFIASGSIALLADLIHNFGDASTAIPLGAAFLLRSARAERWAGLFVVAAIFISACVAGVEAISRLIHPQTPTHLLALAAAGLIGFGGNWCGRLAPTAVPSEGRTENGKRNHRPAGRDCDCARAA